MTSFFRLYDYVGPDEIRARVQEDPAGHLIRGQQELRGALRAIQSGQTPVTVTYVVDSFGRFRIADRCSEHVACANGGPVLAAGELTFFEEDTQFYVDDVTNLSTGFCPEPSCWAALAWALDNAEIAFPETWTHSFEFRRCEDCGGRSVIKDDDYTCVECEADLACDWNFDKTYIKRAFITCGESRWLVDTIEETGSAGQDRVGVSSNDDGLVIVLADGAGGTSKGGIAAERTVAALLEPLPYPLVGAMHDIDRGLHGDASGQTTVVVCSVSLGECLRVYGASVGDSAAYAISTHGLEELTEHQSRKPLVGSGRAEPREFCTRDEAHALLIGSDGLFKYAEWQKLVAWTENHTPDSSRMLVDLARLPSGGLQDDFSAVWIRREDLRQQL